ncbi:MAG: Gx transporter family protein [Acholeplasmatales bacterium]|nr:Gx transporter family protein [Acholeplasmatales bacterium]
MNGIKRIAIISMLAAIAIVLGYAESLIPLSIPGVKLGLANVIILIMIYEFKWYEALGVNVIRILIVSLIRGTFLSAPFFMSLSGGLLSFIMMLLFSKIKIFTSLGVSVLGSIFHVTGQILVAIIIMGTNAIIYYLPFIALLSLLTGVLSGLITYNYLSRHITEKFINKDFRVEEKEGM